MSVYAIGDIQGCYDSLQKLLSKIKFNPDKDTLWFTGDLVNRGNKSLKTLRFIKSLGDSAITVLGNHDLHLLAIANGIIPLGRNITLRKIILAKDCDELMDWLRTQPLIHVNKKLGYGVVHAGITPGWSVKQALKYAAEVENVLRGDDYVELLKYMYGDTPRRWKKSLSGEKRLRYIVNSFTRMRYCTEDGDLNFSVKGKPKYQAIGLTKGQTESQKLGLIPWFDAPNQKIFDLRIIFGHWSALEYFETDTVISLDTGCVWGKRLTAIKLKKHKTKCISIKCD